MADDKLWTIRYRHYYSEDDRAIPGFRRFYSADRRFPMSISFPAKLSDYFDYGNTRNMSLDLREGTDLVLSVAREDLADIGLSAARAVVEGRRDMIWYQMQEMESRKQNRYPRLLDLELGIKKYQMKTTDRDMAFVGDPPFKAPRIVFTTRGGGLGEWVFFWQDMVLFTIIRLPGAHFSDQTFQTVLRSFRWLSDGFFRSLPA